MAHTPTCLTCANLYCCYISTTAYPSVHYLVYTRIRSVSELNLGLGHRVGRQLQLCECVVYMSVIVMLLSSCETTSCEMKFHLMYLLTQRSKLLAECDVFPDINLIFFLFYFYVDITHLSHDPCEHWQ